MAVTSVACNMPYHFLRELVDALVDAQILRSPVVHHLQIVIAAKHVLVPGRGEVRNKKHVQYAFLQCEALDKVRDTATVIARLMCRID